MDKQELFEQIADQFATLQENHEGSTKASQARARKAAGEIKKLITPYKKANMDAVKGQRGRFSLTDEVAPREFDKQNLSRYPLEQRTRISLLREYVVANACSHYFKRGSEAVIIVIPKARVRLLH